MLTASAAESIPSEELVEKECDLVMKGGITSGIVYPRAVQELHKAGYQFRSIGGTSAGAIAAGLAAAAQYSGAEGFRRLEVVSNQLAERGFLLSLFQPSTEDAKTLFNLVNAVRRQATPTARIQAILGTLGGRAGRRAAQGAALGGLLGAGPLLLAAGAAALLGWDARAGLLAAGVGGCVSGLVGFLLGRSLGSVESLPGLAANALAEESSFG